MKANILFIISFGITLWLHQPALHAQPNELWRAVEAWCDQNFENCYIGRTFAEISSIERTINHSDHFEVRGKLIYKNWLDIPQLVSFRMYVYKTRVYFKKQSLMFDNEGNSYWGWEDCSRRH